MLFWTKEEYQKFAEELIVQRLEIGLRIGLALLIPISEQLVLPCNHIFGGDLVDFPLAEVREQLRFDDILLGLPCAFFQPRLEIVGVDFTERLKAHVQISGILLLKLLLPFQCFSPGDAGVFKNAVRSEKERSYFHGNQKLSPP